MKRPVLDGLRTSVPHAAHRRGALVKTFRQVGATHLRGDYFEFGLYRGSTFCHAQRTAERLLPSSSMRFFGFDSFQGLPEPTGIEMATGEFRKGDFACTVEDVRAKLDRRRVDRSRVHLIEGWYEDSLTDELKRRLGTQGVAVALVDCDLYRSTVLVLRFLESLLQEGSILLFDDWDCFGRSDHMGERRAFREFLRANPRFTSEQWIRFGRRGQGFVMHVA